MGPVARLLGRRARLLLACGGTPVLLGLLQVEWAHPACNDPKGQAILAVHGFPLPYAQWANSSMEYHVLLHVWLLDLLLLGVAAYALVTGVLRLLPALRSVPTQLRAIAGATGALCCVLSVVWYASLFATEVLQPAVSLGGPAIGSYEDYTDLRPIRFSSDWNYVCEHSDRWFGK